MKHEVCPYCGSEHELNSVYSINGEIWYAWCPNPDCGHDLITPDCYTKGQARKYWDLMCKRIKRGLERKREERGGE